MTFHKISLDYRIVPQAYRIVFLDYEIVPPDYRIVIRLCIVSLDILNCSSRVTNYSSRSSKVIMWMLPNQGFFYIFIFSF